MMRENLVLKVSLSYDLLASHYHFNPYFDKNNVAQLDALKDSLTQERDASKILRNSLEEMAEKYQESSNLVSQGKDKEKILSGK